MLQYFLLGKVFSIEFKVNEMNENLFSDFKGLKSEF